MLGYWESGQQRIDPWNLKRFCTSALEVYPARPTVVSRLLILAWGEFCTAIGTKNITMISDIAARKENNTMTSRFIGPFFSLPLTAAENVYWEF